VPHRHVIREPRAGKSINAGTSRLQPITTAENQWKFDSFLTDRSLSSPPHFVADGSWTQLSEHLGRQWRG